MIATAAESVRVATRVRSFAQVSLCRGCCCGRVDRGNPPLPDERLKAAWKAGRLNRHVQLTISGCLGPCDVVNVAVVTTPRGQHWFGGLTTDADYDLLLDWARAAAGAGEPVAFSNALEAFRFDRWAACAEAVK